MIYKACFQKSTICAEWIAMNCNYCHNVDVTSWRCDVTYVHGGRMFSDINNLWLTIIFFTFSISDISDDHGNEDVRISNPHEHVVYEQVKRFQIWKGCKKILFYFSRKSFHMTFVIVNIFLCITSLLMITVQCASIRTQLQWWN